MQNIEIQIARHGTTDFNQKDLFQGQNDSPLLPQGLDESTKIAQRLCESKPPALFSSDLPRAALIGERVASALGLTLNALSVR